MTARLTWLSLAALLLAPALEACTFCDEASVRTLLFVATFLGLFSSGMAFFALAYLKAGAFRKGNQAELRVLEVEGIRLNEVKHV